MRSNGTTSTIVCTTGSTTCTDSAPDGTYTYTVTATWRSWTSQATSNSVTVNDTLDHFSVSAPPSATAGSSISVTVSAKNSANQTIPDYTGAIHFSSSDSQASLPADYTFTTGTGNDNGTHTFDATLKTAGNRTVAVNDTVETTKTGSASVSISAAAASILSVSGYASPTTAGVAHNFTVTAQDGFGNTATGYTGMVHFTSSDNQAALPANYTFTTGAGNDNGTHTFSATLKTAGAQSITATDTTTSTIAGSQTGIAVNPAGASTLSVSGYPSPTTAGVAHNFTVTAQDPFGNTATAYTGMVHFTSSDNQAGLPANYTFTTGAGNDNGTHTFSATLQTAGTESITATDTTASTITGSQTGISVVANGNVSFTTAGSHTLTVPAHVTSVQFTLDGGGGGSGASGGSGGAGGLIQGTMTLPDSATATNLTVMVGAGGGSTTGGGPGGSGFADGGKGGDPTQDGGGGGGATGIYVVASSPVAVAGGGGGGGGNGSDNANTSGGAGTGGSAVNPGSSTGGSGIPDGGVHGGGGGVVTTTGTVSPFSFTLSPGGAGTGGATGQGSAPATGGSQTTSTVPVCTGGTGGGAPNQGNAGGGAGGGGGLACGGGGADGPNNTSGGGGGGGAGYSGGSITSRIAVTIGVVGAVSPSNGGAATLSGANAGNAGSASFTGSGITGS